MTGTSLLDLCPVNLDDLSDTLGGAASAADEVDSQLRQIDRGYVNVDGSQEVEVTINGATTTYIELDFSTTPDCTDLGLPSDLDETLGPLSDAQTELARLGQWLRDTPAAGQMTARDHITAALDEYRADSSLPGSAVAAVLAGALGMVDAFDAIERSLTETPAAPAALDLDAIDSVRLRAALQKLEQSGDYEATTCRRGDLQTGDQVPGVGYVTSARTVGGLTSIDWGSDLRDGGGSYAGAHTDDAPGTGTEWIIHRHDRAKLAALLDDDDLVDSNEPTGTTDDAPTFDAPAPVTL